MAQLSKGGIGFQPVDFEHRPEAYATEVLLVQNFVKV